jgi:hypothetical protein
MTDRSEAWQDWIARAEAVDILSVAERLERDADYPAEAAA